MALPPHLLGNFSASELEFIAEEELINIVPNVKIPALYLIGVSLIVLNNNLYTYII
jgi:hypothetical protein